MIQVTSHSSSIAYKGKVQKKVERKGLENKSCFFGGLVFDKKVGSGGRGASSGEGER